jgi:peptidoglycan/xylan/chitin deacetylase (PgdA/CDA1 family)
MPSELKVIVLLVCLYFICKWVLSKIISDEIKGFENNFWPHNKKCAYISTWDDYKNIDSYEYIAKYANEYDIPITMFIDNLNDDKINQRYVKLLSHGNDIQSHTQSHPYIRKLNTADAQSEYINSKKNIKNKFGDKYGDFLAYPFGEIPYDRKVIDSVRNTYIASRSIKQGLVGIGSNTQELNCIEIEDPDLNKKMDEAILKKAILITYGHGVKGIGGYSPVDKDILLKHFEYIHKNRNDIWFTTLPELFSYLKLKNRINGIIIS